LKIPKTYYFLLPACLFWVGCNGGGDGASTGSASTATEAPSALDIVGSEIAFNPIIKFTTATDCTYDNTLAIENTFPQPASLIEATYTAFKNGGTLTVTISSTDSTFGEDLVLVMTGWTDTDNDGRIDQFSIQPTLGDDLPLAQMTGQFTENPPIASGSALSASSLPVFAGGDSNRSPTLAEWNNFVVGKQLVFIYTDGNISSLNMQTTSSYSATDSQGHAVQGTYDYDRIDDSTGRLTIVESKSYIYGQSQTAFSTVITSDRRAIFSLNFYNTDPLSDSFFNALGGLGIHFLNTTDEETLSTGAVTTKEAAYGRLRVYNDASLLTE
jgi:hypothetical protein